MLEVSNLTRYYGSTLAVDNVSFQVERGSIIGLLGPNGAGKSTIMRILTCYIPATSGNARVCGLDVFEQSMAVRRRIGYLPENPPLYDELTVESYLKYIARLKEVPARELKSRLDYVLDLFGITHVRKRYIEHLSRGYRQRVGLAQALINDPEVIILDEPTVGLDPQQINDVRAAIKALAVKHTVLLSTHILPEVSMTCDSVIILNKGRVAATDTIENLEQKLAGQRRLRLLVHGDESALLAAIKKIQGVDKVLALHRDANDTLFHIEGHVGELKNEFLIQSLVEAGYGVKELYRDKASLEDIYLKLVSDADAEVADA